MYGYGVEHDFVVKIGVLLLVIILLMFFFNMIMSKWFNVKGKNFFSLNYVNEKHKKMDRIIRVLTIISLLVGFAINAKRDPGNWYWFLQPWSIIYFSVLLSQIVRGYMEKKYDSNPNAYKLTISETLFMFILVIVIINTSFLGLV
ncbi:DUF4181 domain-containing protein [Ornithinibacillus halophilus]|uniref:DUF4181 domain-containing protein n=1 Tax=Ornithinibacillus halophilus TaxID=930117 RepID=A0A1M5L970_9BACI|nr:DUF4181 domain-containing protein [Ornithinibacillus halophilus]SHG61538.1 protein of unknown function [Ornithinibacillus halophilus]